MKVAFYTLGWETITENETGALAQLFMKKTASSPRWTAGKRTCTS
ncbi:MAG: hypothetical protein V8T36_10040 [Ruthenibacterium lactatiformans]